MVSVHALDPDNPISDLGEAYIFCKKLFEKNQNKQKEAGVGPFKNERAFGLEYPKYRFLYSECVLKKVKDLKTAFHSFKLKSSVGQCDRAEQILKYFGYKFSLKRSPNFGAFRGAILKYGTFQIKTPLNSFFGNYWKKLGYF